MPAIAEAPPVVTPAPSFGERMKQAAAASVAAGGPDGVITPELKAEAAEAPLTEAKPVAKEVAKPVAKETPKVETKTAAKTEAKEEVKPAVEENPFAKLDALRETLPDGETTEVKPGDKPTEKKPENKEEFTFKRLREERDTFQKELNEIKAKVGDTDVPALKKQLEEAQKDIDAKSKKLAALDATEDPIFQKNVAIPCQQIVQTLQEDAKDYGFEWKAFTEAVNNPDRRARAADLDAILSSAEKEIPSLEKTDIANRVSEYLQRQDHGAKILQEAQGFLEISKAEKAKKEQFDKAKAEGEFQRISEIVFDHMTSEEMVKSMPFLADSTGKIDPAKAEAIRKANAYGEVKPASRSIDAYSSAILPMAINHIKERNAKIAELEKRIGELTSASPGINTSSGETAKTADDGLTFTERMRKARQA